MLISHVCKFRQLLNKYLSVSNRDILIVIWIFVKFIRLSLLIAEVLNVDIIKYMRFGV